MSLERYFRRVLPRFLYPGGQKGTLLRYLTWYMPNRTQSLIFEHGYGVAVVLITWFSGRSSLFPNEWCPSSLVDMVSTKHRERTIHTGIKLHCTVCATRYAQIENSATTCDACALLEFMTLEFIFDAELERRVIRANTVHC